MCFVVVGVGWSAGGPGDRSCVELFESMGMGTLDAYVADLEEKLLQNTKEHYARKSHEWIETDSTPDYMIKVRNKQQTYNSTDAREGEGRGKTGGGGGGLICSDDGRRRKGGRGALTTPDYMIDV